MTYKREKKILLILVVLGLVINLLLSLHSMYEVHFTEGFVEDELYYLEANRIDLLVVFMMVFYLFIEKITTK